MKCSLSNTCKRRFLCCHFCDDKKCDVRCLDELKTCKFFCDVKCNPDDLDDVSTSPIKRTVKLPTKPITLKNKKEAK